MKKWFLPLRYSMVLNTITQIYAIVLLKLISIYLHYKILKQKTAFFFPSTYPIGMFFGLHLFFFKDCKGLYIHMILCIILIITLKNNIISATAKITMLIIKFMFI